MSKIITIIFFAIESCLRCLKKCTVIVKKFLGLKMNTVPPYNFYVPMHPLILMDRILSWMVVARYGKSISNYYRIRGNLA